MIRIRPEAFCQLWLMKNPLHETGWPSFQNTTAVSQTPRSKDGWVHSLWLRFQISVFIFRKSFFLKKAMKIFSEQLQRLKNKAPRFLSEAVFVFGLPLGYLKYCHQHRNHSEFNQISPICWESQFAFLKPK